jgi:hypothetical protein
MDQINLAVIGFENVQLLFPQSGIATIEMIENMEAESDAGGAVGRLRTGGREWPVYALDADLSRRSERSASNKYCVAFDIDGQPAFSIACDQVSSMTLDSPDQIKPLQGFMRNANNPIEALLLQDDRLMLVSQVDSMHRFLVTDLAADLAA